MQDPSRRCGKGLAVEYSELFGIAQDFERPMPSYDFGDIEENSVPDFIAVWNFLSIFRYFTVLI